MGLEKIVDIIYPVTCPLCGSVLPYSEKGVCVKCLKKLKWVESPVCMRCGKMIDDPEEEYCKDCTSIPKSFEKNYAAFCYEGEIKDSLYAFKYKNKREYAGFYADSIISKYGHELSKNGIDGIVPVPLNSKRLKQRGYNQAELLAKEIGKALKITVYPDYLKRCIATDPQKELNDRERMKNLKNAFIIGQNDVKLKQILLVDDIYTSGATMDACTRVLLMSGVERVYCVSVAIGRGYQVHEMVDHFS